MIYITQLIYIKENTEAVFDEFESVAIPIISRYNGKMMLRLRPGKEAVIESGIDAPYEVHLVSFETEPDFQNFMRDEERKKFLHLKEQAIKSVMLFKGEKI